MRMSERLYHILAKMILAVVVVVFAGVIIFVGMQVSGRSKLYSKNKAAVPELAMASVVYAEAAEPVAAQFPGDDWQEGDVRYQGVHYRYNDDILTFLFLGIDKMTEVKPVKDGIDGGQSDAIFLLVLNPHNMEATVIGVPRDTMTEVYMYDRDGSYLGIANAQITLQHGYGDGAQVSCERSLQAVSRLFYNLPIHGYCAINMGAIPLINDAVGGVEVTVLEDVIHTKMKKGQTVHLKGMDSYYYLHNRDTKSDGSAGRRLERQKQYLTAYAATALEAMKKDITVPITLYNTISKYMVTDISVDEVSYLATQAAGYRFSSDSMFSLEGENVIGEKFEEFYVDEKALYELILDVFYEEVEETVQ